MIQTELQSARGRVNESGKTLFQLYDLQSSLKELQQERQTLIAEINAAKLKAIEEIDAKFADKLEEIDSLETTMLIMSCGKRNND